VSAVYYTKAAELDLDSIAAYTLKHWGAAQADKYLALLQTTCEEIIPQNQQHASAVAGRPELRRWRCEHHVIFFRTRGSGFEIARIPHERMLPQSHL
jgi:toxin ParE1/3/4